MEQIDVAKIILATTGGLAVLAPVLAISARIALRPITDAIARLRESGTAGESMRLLEQRVDLISQEVHEVQRLREQVERLAEAQEFQLRLAARSEPSRDA